MDEDKRLVNNAVGSAAALTLAVAKGLPNREEYQATADEAYAALLDHMRRTKRPPSILQRLLAAKRLQRRRSHG